MRNKIKYVFVLIIVCVFYSHIIFAAAEANPRRRDVAAEYLEKKPLGIPPLVDIFEKYVEPTFESVGIRIPDKGLRITSSVYETSTTSTHNTVVLDIHSEDTWQDFINKLQNATGVSFVNVMTTISRETLIDGIWVALPAQPKHYVLLLYDSFARGRAFAASGFFEKLSSAGLSVINNLQELKDALEYARLFHADICLGIKNDVTGNFWLRDKDTEYWLSD
jgi:hypothetical protein